MKVNPPIKIVCPSAGARKTSSVPITGAGPRAIVHDDALPKRLGERRLKRACGDVDRPGRREGHHDAQRLGGKRLGEREGARAERGDQRRDAGDACHGVSKFTA
jgi:hypothetical protein